MGKVSFDELVTIKERFMEVLAGCAERNAACVKEKYLGVDHETA
jgi:hypothetical protein